MKLKTLLIIDTLLTLVILGSEFLPGINMSYMTLDMSTPMWRSVNNALGAVCIWILFPLCVVNTILKIIGLVRNRLRTRWMSFVVVAFTIVGIANCYLKFHEFQENERHEMQSQIDTMKDWGIKPEVNSVDEAVVKAKQEGLNLPSLGSGFYLMLLSALALGAMQFVKRNDEDEQIASQDLPEETTSGTFEFGDEENTDNRKKWYYICGVVAVLAVIIGILTCSDSKKSSGEFAGKPISELFPEVAKAADAGTIPDEAITYIWENSQGEECEGDVTVVRKADENQMVVMYETTSCDANTLRLGVYQNGQYVFYYEILVGGIDYEEAKSGIMLKNNPPESIVYYGYYGQDCAKTIEHEWGTEITIDWDKITEAQLAEIFAAAIAEGPKEPFIITDKFIKEAKSQNIEASVEESEIENPAITEQLDEFERAIAEVNDRVERHQTSGSIVDSDICNGVQEMHNGLAEARGEMSEGQQIRFDQLVEKANQLYEFAERIRQTNGPAEAEAVDSVMLE